MLKQEGCDLTGAAFDVYNSQWHWGGSVTPSSEAFAKELIKFWSR